MAYICYGCITMTEEPVCPWCGWQEGKDNEPHQLPVGTRLQGRYLLGRVLGQGDFGITYLGWDPVRGERVAVKEYFPRGRAERENAGDANALLPAASYADQYQLGLNRFLREAQALSQVREPGTIVEVWDVFTENNTAYTVMAYIPGMTLQDYLISRGGGLTPEETFRLLWPLMVSLERLHRQRILHMDINLESIVLHPQGGVRLLDFGMVRRMANIGADGKQVPREIQSGLLPPFTALEQHKVNGHIGPWTDVYGICAVIYSCLTGRMPVPAISRLMDEDLDWNALPLTKHQKRVLQKGLALKPQDRYPHMGALLDDFSRSPAERQTPQKQKAPPKKKRGTFPGWIIGILLLLLIASLGAWAFLYVEDDTFRPSGKDASLCDHEWSDATCTDPARCGLCGETGKEAPGHSWQTATCQEPATCDRCGLTQGEPVEHTWLNATADAPMTCIHCGETQGAPIPPISMDHVTRAYASSVFIQEDRMYYSEYVLDNNLSTAWVEGIGGQGIGEFLTLEFDGEYLVKEIEIWAGYHKSDRLYELNSRPKLLELTLSDGTILDAELADVMESQIIYLGEGVVTKSITFTLVSVYPGGVAEDTCISEIKLR